MFVIYFSGESVLPQAIMQIDFSNLQIHLW